jgi:hypothetical protein
MPEGELSVDFTTEELVVLAGAAGTGLPVGLGDPTDDLPKDVLDLLQERARAALIARRVLVAEEEDSEPEPVEAVSTLLRATASPGLLVTASLEQEGVVETRSYCALPDLSVEHQSLASSVFRFTPFATRDLLARVFRFVDLRPAAVVDVPPFTVAAATLAGAAEQVVGHDHQQAVLALTGAGVPVASAEAFVEAIKAKRASASITVLFKPEESKVAGGQLTWIDAGLQGLWLTEQGSDDSSLSVRSVAAEELSKELLSYLPDPFSESPSSTS